MINFDEFLADYHRSFFTLFPYMMLICAVKWNLEYALTLRFQSENCQFIGLTNMCRKCGLSPLVNGKIPTLSLFQSSLSESLELEVDISQTLKMSTLAINYL